MPVHLAIRERYNGTYRGELIVAHHLPAALIAKASAVRAEPFVIRILFAKALDPNFHACAQRNNGEVERFAAYLRFATFCVI